MNLPNLTRASNYLDSIRRQEARRVLQAEADHDAGIPFDGFAMSFDGPPPEDLPTLAELGAFG